MVLSLHGGHSGGGPDIAAAGLVNGFDLRMMIVAVVVLALVLLPWWIR